MFALALVLHTARAGACSCEPVTPSAALGRSDHVFQGKVIAVRNAWGNALPVGLERLLPRWMRPDRGLLVELEVSGVWKGGSGPRQVVFTGFGGGDCGLGAEVGDEWLVYGWSWGNQVASGLCSGSGPVSVRSHALGVLGAPHGPAPAPRHRVLYLLLFATLLLSGAFAVRQLSRR